MIHSRKTWGRTCTEEPHHEPWGLSSLPLQAGWTPCLPGHGRQDCVRSPFPTSPLGSKVAQCAGEEPRAEFAQPREERAKGSLLIAFSHLMNGVGEKMETDPS